MLGFWNSASAISAAFFIDCAATPALPEADSGRISPTFVPPVPMACDCCAGPAGGPDGALGPVPKALVSVDCTPAQAPSSGAPSSRPTAVRRVAPDVAPLVPDLGSNGSAITSLLSAVSDRPASSPTI